VLDHLRFYCAIKGVESPEEEIQRLLARVGIADEIDKKTKELSGCTKRKLSLCIALLNSPKLLIFDEPTSGLDPSSRRNIWGILENLRSADSTIVLTTHHLDEADYLSDRICVIKKGKIVEQGTPAEIKEKHGRGYYLTIYHNSESGMPFDVQLCCKLVAEALPHSQLKDQSSEYLKYFITKAEDYQSLINCIKTLERLNSISISLEGNSLEQSFIAINSA
jgi:ABC-type multidrug transport system ATPase subunit